MQLRKPTLNYIYSVIARHNKPSECM